MEFNDFLRPSPKIQGLFNTVQTLDQEFGGGELSLFVCPGVGNRPPRKKKFENPQECAWRGMARGQIELCINRGRRKGVAVKQITQLTQISR